MSEPIKIIIELTQGEDGKYQASIDGTNIGEPGDSAGRVLRAAAMTLGGAETYTNSGHDGEPLGAVGIAFLSKLILSVCIEHLQGKLADAGAVARLKAGDRVHALASAGRIPMPELERLVLETLISGPLVCPPSAEEKLDAELRNIFRHARAPAPAPTAPQTVQTIEIKVVCGDQLVDTQTFSQDAIKIGRLRGSHICLDDEAVARMHAVIEVSNKEVRVIDLGSPTGTLLNGVAVAKIAAIQDGDELTFGPYCLHVSFVKGAA